MCNYCNVSFITSVEIICYDRLNWNYFLNMWFWKFVLLKGKRQYIYKEKEHKCNDFTLIPTLEWPWRVGVLRCSSRAGCVNKVAWWRHGTGAGLCSMATTSSTSKRKTMCDHWEWSTCRGTRSSSIRPTRKTRINFYWNLFQVTG